MVNAAVLYAVADIRPHPRTMSSTCQMQAALCQSLLTLLPCNHPLHCNVVKHNKVTSVLLCHMQLLIDGPSQNNIVYLPDASGTVAVNAEPPLYVDPDGTVYLEQGGIRQVGQLTAGSLGAGFGEC